MQNVSICFQADDFNDFFTVEQGDRIKDVRTWTVYKSLDEATAEIFNKVVK